MSDLLRDIGLDNETEQQTGTSSEEDAPVIEQQAAGPSHQDDTSRLQDGGGASADSEARTHQAARNQHENAAEHQTINQQIFAPGARPSSERSVEVRQDSNLQQGTGAQATICQQKAQNLPGSASTAQADNEERPDYEERMRNGVREFLALAKQLEEQEEEKKKREAQQVQARAQAAIAQMNGSEEQPESCPTGDGIETSEAQVQNPSVTNFVQGRTPDTPQVNNGDIYFHNSSVEGKNALQDSRQIAPEELLPPLRLNTPPLPPSPHMPNTPQTEELPQEFVQINDSPEPSTPVREPRRPLRLEDLQTPVISIYSTSPRFSRERRDDDDDNEKHEEKNSETIGGSCKPQEHLKRDEDDEGDANDQEECVTPRPSRTVTGKARKLSPSTEEEQPRKRRSCTGAEVEEGEASEDPQDPPLAGAQPTSSEQAADANVTDEKQVQELTPSKTPDRPREYTSPPGMAPVSRLELPENFQVAEDTSPLGNARRYQRTNMPSEYVPPQFNEASDSEKDSSSAEEDSSTDDSEAEEQEVQVRANIQPVSASDGGSRREAQSRIAADLEAPPSGPQQRNGTQNQTAIPTRQNPMRIPIRRRNMPSNGATEDVYASPEIEAWTESPKVPRPRTHGNQEIIRAENVVIYRVSSNSPRHRATPRNREGRNAAVFRGNSVIEVTRGSGIPGGMMRSNGATAGRIRTTQNVSRSPATTESLNTSTHPPPAQRIPGARTQVPVGRTHWIRNPVGPAVVNVNRIPIPPQHIRRTGNPNISSVMQMNRNPIPSQHMHRTQNPAVPAAMHVNRNQIPSQHMHATGNPVTSQVMQTNRNPIPSQHMPRAGNPVATSVMHLNRDQIPAQHLHATRNPDVPSVMHMNRNPTRSQDELTTGNPAVPSFMHMNRNQIASQHMHRTGNPAVPGVMHMNRNSIPSHHVHATGNPAVPTVMQMNRNQIPPQRLHLTGNPAAPAFMQMNTNPTPSQHIHAGNHIVPRVMRLSRNPIPSQHMPMTGNPGAAPAPGSVLRVTRHPITHEVMHMVTYPGSSQYTHPTRNPGMSEGANINTNPSAMGRGPNNRRYTLRDPFNRN